MDMIRWKSSSPPAWTNPHDDMIACRRHIRDRWSNEIAVSGRDNTDWVSRERAVIASSACQWAEKHGYDERVTASDVERIEVLAVGHIDYFNKLSLYVANATVYGQSDT